MTGKQRIQAILNHEEVDRSAFWMGHPLQDTLDLYYKAFNLSTLEELSDYLENDLIWLPANDGTWRHPEGIHPLDALGGKPRESHNQEGIFANVENVADIHNAFWADPKYFDFELLRPRIERAKKAGRAIFSGVWACFWHQYTDYFGMENCFVKMYTDEALVMATIEHVEEFNLKANKMFFDLFAKDIDVCFFGNDFGTQLDCLISPEMFDKFVLPTMRKLIDQAKGYGLKVAVHSCGAVDRLIPRFIDAGVDILHPIQARARNMDAESLHKKYGDNLVFMGGLDTQDILPFKSAQEVYEEGIRLRKIFGKRFILSPSHEALLPNVSPENLLAMKRAALAEI